MNGRIASVGTSRQPRTLIERMSTRDGTHARLGTTCALYRIARVGLVATPSHSGVVIWYCSPYGQHSDMLSKMICTGCRELATAVCAMSSAHFACWVSCP